MTRAKRKAKPAEPKRDEWAESLKPGRGPYELRVPCEQPGLFMRVQPTGSRSWWARWTVRGSSSGDGRFRIGSYPTLSREEAIGECYAALKRAERGDDPQEARRAARKAAAKRRAGERVEQVVGKWKADPKLGPVGKWKGGLEGGTARSFLCHVRAFVRELGARKLADVTARQVEAFVSAPETAPTRNRRLTALRLFYAWAKRKGLAEADPTAGIPKETETPRARVLSDDELRALVVGMDGTRFGRAVRLLCLTALRREEVLGARWEWCDLDAGVMTIPPEAEKTGEDRGEPRLVALSPQAVAILTAQRKAQLAEGARSEWIFATSTGAKPASDSLKPLMYRLRGQRSDGSPASDDKRAKKRTPALPADVRIHDVRRTVASALLTRLGVLHWTVDKLILGHVRTKVERTYMPSLAGKPLDEARAALTRWAEQLDSILGGQTAAARE